MEDQAKVLAEGVQSLEDADSVEPIPVISAVRSVNGRDAGEPNGQFDGSRGTAPTLHVRVDAARFGEEGLHRLKDLLAERTGDQPVVLHLLTGGQEVVLDAREMKVTVSEDLRAELEAWLGAGSVWQE